MQPWKQLGRYGTVGLELVLSMGIGYWIGHWADGKLGTKFLALIGMLVGVIAGFRNLLRAASLMQREADREAEADLRKGPDLLARGLEAESPRAKADKKAEGGEREGGRPGKDDAPISVNARGSKDGDAPS